MPKANANSLNPSLPEPKPTKDRNESPNQRNPIITPITAQSLPKPESSRLVNQIDHALNDSLGPAPEVESAKAGVGGEPALSEAEGSIHFTIQQHILAITNNGRTLFDTLAEIARAKDDPKAKPSHRARATRILIDRVLGANTALPRSAPHAEPAKQKPYRRPVRYVDPVKLAEARAEIQRMKDEGILTPDPTRPKIDISSYLPPDDFDLTPYAKEEAAAFWADIELKYERQQQWPEIEERRRKKLEQTYPSHSEEDEPPDP